MKFDVADIIGTHKNLPHMILEVHPSQPESMTNPFGSYACYTILVLLTGHYRRVYTYLVDEHCKHIEDLPDNPVQQNEYFQLEDCLVIKYITKSICDEKKIDKIDKIDITFEIPQQ